MKFAAYSSRNFLESSDKSIIFFAHEDQDGSIISLFSHLGKSSATHLFKFLMIVIDHLALGFFFVTLNLRAGLVNDDVGFFAPEDCEKAALMILIKSGTQED